VDAHVIPRSFFKVTRGTGKHSILIGVDEKKLDRKFKQAGVSDKTILCEQCERLFTPYDKHGFEAVIEMLDSKQIYQDELGNPCAYIAKKANYDLFKLFILSVLWRASVSSIEFYEAIKLGAHEERIQRMLADNNPGSQYDYPIVCFYQFGQHYPSIVLPSFQQRIGGVNFCRLYLPHSLIFLVKVDSRPLSSSLLSGILRPNSPIHFLLFPYFGSPEMQYVENAKILTKKHLGIPLRTVYRYEKPKIK
jgi:hypothetical protein